MIGFLVGAVRRHRARRAFHAYGFDVRRVTLAGGGEVEVARWKHPLTQPRVFSQDDIDGLRHFVRPGDTVIDVGARDGAATVAMALACGPQGVVIALEPNPHAFPILEENARRHRDHAHIVALNFAATEDDGDYQFHYRDASFGSGGYLSRLRNAVRGPVYPLRVKGRNPERYLRAHFADRLPRLSLVRTGCAGYDKDVLRSLRGVLTQFQPVVVCDVHELLDADERYELYDVLASAGYTLRRYRGGREPIGEALARDDVATSRAHSHLLALPAGFDMAASASAVAGERSRGPVPVAVERRASGAGRARRVLKVVAWVFVAGLTLAVSPVIAFRWIDPPTSAFMMQRRVEGVVNPSRRVAIRHQWTDLDRISKNARLAMIAAEDQRFIEHDGFDFEAIEKARAHNRRGRRLRGASTISQQVAKNLFLWPGRSWVRKGLEAGYTVLIEALWPKRRVLEVYLNIAEFGDGVYGVGAASTRFFDKSPARLSRHESALLAAVLPNPKSYHVDRPSKYVQRRAWWIERQMIRLGPAALGPLAP